MTVINTAMPQALWPGIHDWWSKNYSDHESAEVFAKAPLTVSVPTALAMGAAAAVIANPVVTRRFLP